MTILNNSVKALTRSILENALERDWTLQGLGMLRTYIDDERRFRLHVWDSQFAFPGVSVLHTHPWAFDSYIVAGVLENYRYEIVPNANQRVGDTHLEAVILCGPGGHMESEPRAVYLRERPVERYSEGSVYWQQAQEIHQSCPQDGTVTIVERRFDGDTEHALVYWPVGQEWVSAEPREATEDEIRVITTAALERWFV